MLFRPAPVPTRLRTPPASSAASPLPGRPPDRALRIALLVYRGNPRCGGQGVYVRHLSRALSELGHQVEVFSGPPYPEVGDPARLVRVGGLDLYREPDPFRVPGRSEFRSPVDVLEYLHLCTAGFPEPLAFSLRAWGLLRRRLADFDVVHDNQSLGYGFLPLLRSTLPVVASIHHAITIDRRLDLAAAPGLRRRLALRRWYGFARMQSRVARRVPRILTVSAASARDIVAELGIDAARVHVVHLGADTDHFRPLPQHRRVPGCVLTTASADVPLKGLVHLVEALPGLRERRPDAHLVVVGRPRESGAALAAIARLRLPPSTVRFEPEVSDRRLVELFAEAECAVVPSLYEGFSLPALEAMACGCPLVVSAVGAIPEVVGPSGEAALHVDPASSAQLAAAIATVLGDAGLRARLGEAGRRRALERFSWRATAAATVEHYRAAIAERCGAAPGA